MEDKIKFLGLSAFQITTSKSKVILIDPFISKNPVLSSSMATLTLIFDTSNTKIHTDTLIFFIIKLQIYTYFYSKK